MEGVVELAEEIFHMPVRIACPQNVRGLADVVRNPIYSTGVGLLHYGMKQERHTPSSTTVAVRREESAARRVHGQEHDTSTLERIKGWFKGNF